jgi:WD40 repeat protein/nucleoside phosphorylase
VVGKSQADVLLVTVTDVETRAVLAAFLGPSEQDTPEHIHGRVYYDLGTVHGARVMLTRSEMGAGGLGAAQQAVSKGIAALSPRAVIMVGIAFGVSDERQSIGDVLVTEHLRPYDLQRVGTHEDGSVKIVLRGDKPHASPLLLDLFKNAAIRWKGAKVRFGTVLTGEKLVDNLDFRAELRAFEPEAIGGEMEGAGLYVACYEPNVHWILVKAICDFADGQKGKDKDERQALAAKNAADFALHALRFVKIDWSTPWDEDRRTRRELRDKDERVDGFLARIERVALLRDPGATVTRHRAPSPFAGVLEVAVQDGDLVDLRVIAGLEPSITEELVDRYQAEIELPFRQQDPLLRSTLIHGGASAPAELARAAMRRGVVLKSFGEYQRLFDFGPYLDKQTQRLDADPVYPPELYVEQPARVSLAGGREEQPTERAVETLWELLEAPHPRFALVLGDFGAGKTFLLHELARRMARDKHPLVPVIVEMSKLEKQSSLKALLAQHFANADVGRIDLDAFQYLLAEGRIALLFDGFDELALRLTYDRAVEHFETVIAAAHGNAKVVVTSRTQHFLTDQQVRRALAERAELVPGYRLFQLDKFGDKQIRRFLRNLIPTKEEAEERYRLLDEVKDLLGLSENPRMLGFIAKIAPDKLLEAKKQSGEITAAKLYEILIGQWLDFEFDRVNPPGAPRGISRAMLRELVTKLAGVFWERNAKALGLGECREMLVVEGIEPAVVEHMIGSGSLLVRDAEGQFSFVHRSVMEWLVADAAAVEVKARGDAAALGADEMSALMADFLISLAGREAAERWAYDKGGRASGAAAKKNAAWVLKRIEALAGADGGEESELFVTMDLEGQDLRGQDWSRVDWRGASLNGADLRSATLIAARLNGASLVGAKLGRADLQWANLAGADLAGADLGFARLTGADLRGAKNLAGAHLGGAKLVGAEGVAGVTVEELVAAGAAPPVPGQAEPMWAPASLCNAVAWSPSGDLVASGHADGAVRLWDAATGKAIRTLADHAGTVRSIAFSPDGQRLATGSADKTVRLWEVGTARFVRTLEGHTHGIISVAFSPDGQRLATGSADKTVRLWEVGTARFVRALKGHTNWVMSVAFSPDGQTLATGSYDKTVRLWEIATARFVRALEGHTDGVMSVAFSPDGRTLATGSYDQTVRLWEIATARFARALEGHTDGVMSVAFSPDGQTLATGSYDKTVRLWEVGTARFERALAGHTDRVMSVAFSPDGRTLATGSSDQRVRLWEVATARFVRALAGHTGWVSSVAFSPDGRTLATGSTDQRVRLWEVATARFERALEGHTGGVLSVAFSPDGQRLATGSSDKTVRLWEVATARFERALEGHTDGVLSVAFSPDGQTLATGSSDQTVRLWEVATARFVRALEGHTGRILSVAFSPNGRTLVTGSDDPTVRLWEVATARTKRALEGHTGRVLSVAFSSDGRTLATGSDDQTVRLWDVATGRALRAFEGHTNGVTSVAFSPNGTLLASASADGTLRLWDVATARCLAILLPCREGWAAFTPDGRYKLGGDIAGSFWHVIGLCRFEPGELDPYAPHLRVPDDAPLLAVPSARNPDPVPGHG